MRVAFVVLSYFNEIVCFEIDFASLEPIGIFLAA